MELMNAFIYLLLLTTLCKHVQPTSLPDDIGDKYNGRVVKGNRNALFLVLNGARRQFPDFYTFSKMGFNVTSILKIRDEVLTSIPLGPYIKLIPAPPPFRPDDYMYHEQCGDPDKMINDLGLVPNLGHYFRYSNVVRRVRKRKRIDILALGGSITAGGYFMEFVRALQEKENLTVAVHNHGHGATEITYTIFCVDIEKYEPDLVLIDFSVNDYGHPKLMEALLRKTLQIRSNPIVMLMNMWVYPTCATTRYLIHSFYYGVPLINVCPAVNLCFGKPNHSRLPKWIAEQYSKTDGIHPWGSRGVGFIGGIMYSWWRRYDEIVSEEIERWTEMTVEQDVGKMDLTLYRLPPPLFQDKPLGTCTRCDALVDDADARLTPIERSGFRIVTRVKVGYGGFHPNDTRTGTKSFKRSWQADKAGATIAFKFFGSSVKVAMWQRRDGMGILLATVDGDASRVAKASGFFKGYTWAMEKNNTGRSEIMPLFEGLEDKEHVIKFTVSKEPANVWVKGHTVQIFAILSASNHADCKTKLRRIRA